MGVRAWLADLAVSSPRALVVEAPGRGEARVRLEGALRRRGWALALSPADADVLLVVGVVDGALAEAVERTWDQLPGPRARGALATDGPGAAEAVLDAAAAVLRDQAHQRADAAAREPWSAGGIALAVGDGSDRDGLEMDVLHVPLGPILPAWPAGLVVRTTLAGDVVTAADVEALPAGAPPPPTALPDGALDAALLADRAARLLTLAGAGGPAAELVRWRDGVLETAPGAPGSAVEAMERIERRVARSRVLRWSLRGLGPLDGAALAEHGLPASAGGDVHDRLLAMLADARAALLVAVSGGAGSDGAQGGVAEREAVAAAVRAALPAMVVGYELAAARLVVASLPDPTVAGPRTVGDPSPRRGTDAAGTDAAGSTGRPVGAR